MGKKDPRIDAYIAKSQEFARPVLIHIRDLVHKACPEVNETVKWGMPYFDFKGPLCSMASFKAHCAFGFWKGKLLKGMPKHIQKVGDTAMGQFGRITSQKDLPADTVMLDLIRQAKKLNDDGIKITPAGKTDGKAKKQEIPDYFINAVRKNKKALITFEGFSYTNKKDYVEWVTDAKTEETRNSRIKTSVEWMSEGKPRNWKYMKK
ncbi:MAG TPA: DUF1801 domain-containing protein [Cyclobacteriaceae bacterium]|nr:DUF1801 domain-containing protein [Cyclobacteriaceae bacterium]